MPATHTLLARALDNPDAAHLLAEVALVDRAIKDTLISILKFGKSEGASQEFGDNRCVRYA